MNLRRHGWLGGPLAALALVLGACAPSDPCSPAARHRLAQTSRRFAGHWAIVRGDTLTLPAMGDRFKLTDVRLDTDTVAVDRTCRLRGRLVFTVPRAETLAVTWLGLPDQVLIYGWPADFGPFAGIAAAISGGDSLRGAILFDARLGVRVRPGVTAQFVAGRAR